MEVPQQRLTPPALSLLAPQTETRRAPHRAAPTHHAQGRSSPAAETLLARGAGQRGAEVVRGCAAQIEIDGLAWTMILSLTHSPTINTNRSNNKHQAHFSSWSSYTPRWFVLSFVICSSPRQEGPPAPRTTTTTMAPTTRRSGDDNDGENKDHDGDDGVDRSAVRHRSPSRRWAAAGVGMD